MKYASILASGLAAAFVTTSALAGTLDDVKARGHLICGVTTGLAGFAAPDDKGIWKGFDVDICRGDLGPAEALAAAKTDDQRFFMTYYLGARALIEGRREDAKNLFEACVARPIYEYSEYDLARGHLRRLLDDPGP